jgi:glucosamine--fructose-6-phosphate aminotransferase (isomerizing)
LQTLLAIDHLVIAACGTSFHSGMFGARLMRLLRAFKTVSVVDAAEMEPMDMPQSAKVNTRYTMNMWFVWSVCKGGLLVISQSGETKDVMRALQLALERDVPCMSVVNAVGSSVARASRQVFCLFSFCCVNLWVLKWLLFLTVRFVCKRCGVYLNAGREVAVASTKVV